MIVFLISFSVCSFSVVVKPAKPRQRCKTNKNTYNKSMPKTTHKRSYKIYAIQYPILLLAATLMVFGFNAKKIFDEQNSPQGVVLGKENAKNEGKGNADKPDKAQGKPEDKGNKGQGSLNAAEHKQKIIEVVGNLNAVSDEEEEVGNEETSEDIDEVVNDELDDVEDVTEAIKAVETRPKWKTLLFGTDYKNLGQLRSHLAHNTNSIRKLSRVQENVQAENQEQVQAQLGELVQERERIRSIITEHEDDFGILGWVFRFLNGYVGGSLDNDIGDDVDVPETNESTETIPL